MNLSDTFAKRREARNLVSEYDNIIDLTIRAALKLISKGKVWTPFDDSNRCYINDFNISDDGQTITCSYDFMACGETDHNEIEYPFALIENPTPEAIEAYRLLLEQRKADMRAAEKAKRAEEVATAEKLQLARLLAKHGMPNPLA